MAHSTYKILATLTFIFLPDNTTSHFKRLFGKSNKKTQKINSLANKIFQNCKKPGAKKSGADKIRPA